MPTLYLVRHGQASFGAEDYDQLSELGRRQSVRLGEYFKQKGLGFDAVLTGTLRRHAQTFEGICEGAGIAPAAMAWPGLNEYDSEALIAAVHPHKLQKPDTPEMYRHHFRLLRDGLGQWMEGKVNPAGMPSYAGFVEGVTSALDHVRREFGDKPDARVLIVSSGGPISTAVGQILGTAPVTTIDLNMRIRNSSVTEFAFTPKRHMLQSYNAVPHLDHADYDGWVTYA